jgi:hypothetical protein
VLRYEGVHKTRQYTSTNLRMRYCRPHFACLPPLHPRKEQMIHSIRRPVVLTFRLNLATNKKNPATDKKSNQVLYPVGRDGWLSNVISRIWGLPMTNAVLNSTQL